MQGALRVGDEYFRTARCSFTTWDLANTVPLEILTIEEPQKLFHYAPQRTQVRRKTNGRAARDDLIQDANDLLDSDRVQLFFWERRVRPKKQLSLLERNARFRPQKSLPIY